VRDQPAWAHHHQDLDATVQATVTLAGHDVEAP
jgi:hypothetical protein